MIAVFFVLPGKFNVWINVLKVLKEIVYICSVWFGENVIQIAVQIVRWISCSSCYEYVMCKHVQSIPSTS